MNNLKNCRTELMQDIENLTAIIKKADAFLIKAPKGKLRISRKRSHSQYYHITEKGNTTGKYIRVQDNTLARELAQKDYYEKIKKVALKELRYKRGLLKLSEKNGVMGVYDAMSIGRKELIHPVIASDEEYINNWLKQPYEHKGFQENEPEYHTRRGERVRSKSELIIANILDEYGIPYKYECPITFPGVGDVFVDFTLLDIRTRKVIFWEHFGLMDDERYLNSFFKKLYTYIKYGIIPGDNFIMTFESKSNPINNKGIEEIVKRVFL